jgi:hypothetical protein
MAQRFTVNKQKISGRYIKNGMLVPGTTVVLVDNSSKAHIDTQLTDNESFWVFENVAAGVYDIRFYEGGGDPNDWIEGVVVADDSAAIPPISYDVYPSITVSEGTPIVTVSGTEMAKVNISLNGLLPKTGILSSFSIYYKRSDDTDYQLLVSHNFVEGTDTVAVGAFINLTEKPEYFDFKAYFFDHNNQPVKANGVVYEATHLNVAFDGVSDVFDYVEVMHLECVNASDPESGDLPDFFAHLKWTDYRELPKSSYSPSGITVKDALGRATTLTYEMSRIISSYGIFMFVSSEGKMPTFRFPGKAALWGIATFGEMPYAYEGDNVNDPNGVWVFLGDFTTTDVEVRVPKDKYVGFWVGARTAKTITSVQTERIAY